MLITARLSRTLSETLGDEAAGDMVEWMHSVDDHRAQLRELHDLGAARIDARFDRVDARFDRVDARFDQVTARFKEVDARFGGIDARFDRIDARLDRIDTLVSDLRSRIDQRFADLIKWSFVFWCGAVAAALWAR